MAKYVTVYLPYATGATSGTSAAGSWINVEGITDIICQVTPKPYYGCAVATAPSATIVVEGTFDDAGITDGSATGFFRMGSTAVTTTADCSLLALTAAIGELAGVVRGEGKLPVKWMRCRITTINVGAPTVLVRGRQLATDNTDR